MTALSTADGSVRWRTPFPQPIRRSLFSELVLAHDGSPVMVMTSRQRTLSDAATGSIRWERDFDDDAATLAFGARYPSAHAVIYVAPAGF